MSGSSPHSMKMCVPYGAQVGDVVLTLVRKSPEGV